jgi:hypothetical protein
LKSQPSLLKRESWLLERLPLTHFSALAAKAFAAYLEPANSPAPASRLAEKRVFQSRVERICKRGDENKEKRHEANEAQQEPVEFLSCFRLHMNFLLVRKSFRLPLAKTDYPYRSLTEQARLPPRCGGRLAISGELRTAGAGMGGIAGSDVCTGDDSDKQ